MSDTRAPSAHVTLPSELNDLIISLVDESSLPACGLVCRAWIPASRARLHRSVALRGSHAELQFAALLASPKNTYLAAVQSLELDGCSCSCLTVLHARLPDFPRLTTLVIGADMVSPVFPALPTVTSLALRGRELQSFPLFAQFLERFPGLQSLDLGSQAWIYADPDRTVDPDALLLTPAPSLHLRGLTMNVKLFEDALFRKWLSSAPVGGFGTHNLTLYLDEWPSISGTVDAVSNFLRNLGDKLKDLKIIFVGPGYGLSASFVETVDLSSNIALTTLHIAGAIRSLACTNHSGHWALVLSPLLSPLLRRIQSPALRSLRLGVQTGRWNHRRGATPAELNHFADTFALPAFGHIEQLAFLKLGAWTEAGGLHKEKFVDVVMERLPNALARAVVFVEAD